MDTSSRTELGARIRQQEVVAELGQQALDADDLDQLMRDAAGAVAETLGCDYCGVLEVLPGGKELVLRQGVGWDEGRVGRVTVPADTDSVAGYTLDAGESVIVDDLATESRFSGADLLVDHDVAGGISVLIGPVDDPWGVLGAHATEPREFTEHDATFVQNVANVLASAVETERVHSELEEMYGRISDAFFALDEEWRFTHLNERAHEVINPEGQRLVGENVWEEFPEAISRQFRAEYEHAMYDQETVAFEEYYPAPLDAWFEVHAYPSESGLSVYFRDVTDRKERERELQKTERRFEAIFEDPNILVGLLDPDGTVLDINGTAMEYIDADLEAVTGEPFWETPWWGTGREVSDDVREWTERAAAGEYVEFETDLTRPDGQRYTINGVFRPVTNDDGDVVSIIVSDRDVTERKERERQLEESEQRYRTLAEYFPNGIVTLFDRDSEYELAAGQGFEDIPVDPADVEGHHFSEVWDADTVETLRPVFEAALDGEERSIELEYEGREWMLHAVPITDERGDVFAGMTMVQDITERKEHQRRLERYKQYTDDVLNAIDDVFYVVDDEGGLRRWNESLSEVTGYADAEIESMSASDFFGADASDFETVIEEGFETGSVLVEAPFRTKDDESIPYEFSAATLEDPRGNAVLAGIGRDITERKEQRRRVEESERRYRTLIENFPNGAVALFDEDLRYTIAGGNLLEAVDVDTDAMVGQGVWERYPADVAAKLEPKFHAALDGEPNDFTVELYDRYWRAHTHPVRDDSGDVFAGMLMVQDITEQVDRERELERALDLLERTERIADVGGWEVDPETEEPFWSDHLFDLLGVDYDEQLSLDEALEVYHTDEDRATVERAIEAALDSGEPFDLVGRFSRPAGDVGRLRVQGEPEVVDGDVVSLRGAAQDVTEQVERERQLEELVDKLETSNERLEQFAYAASHDLQEPLRMVSSYLQLVERRYADELDEDAEEFIEFAVDGAERMRGMIDGLLQYSRVETRGDSFEPVDLDAVLADVREDLQVRITESDAGVTAESLPTVEGDPGQLRQVFQNLLDNAIEYSGDEPPQVHVSAERSEAHSPSNRSGTGVEGDPGMWVVSVSDEGIGIDPEDADHVFEVFQRLHTRDEHAGTGIGLALCERIVERHGGDIWVDSEPGEGATFSFTLPVAGGSDE